MVLHHSKIRNLTAIKNSFKAFSVAVLAFFILSCSAQYNLLKEKKSLEQISKTNCDAFTCISEVDTILQDKLERQGKRMLQIYLLRHAKPNVKKNWFYSAAEAQQYVFDYNSAPIIPFDSSLVSVNLRPCHIIYCSNLPRSQETALNIFGAGYKIVSDSVFREFEIRMIPANSFFKMPLGIWQALSRGSWMLGFNHRGIESHKEAKLRARQAAENLIKVAHDEETAVLVAHGMLNGAISKELEKKGWKLIQRKGHVNLGATILVKTVDAND